MDTAKGHRDDTAKFATLCQKTNNMVEKEHERNLGIITLN
jgi:hypothetical protein